MTLSSTIDLGALRTRDQAIVEARSRYAMRQTHSVVGLAHGEFIRHQHALLRGIHTPVEMPRGLTRRQAVDLMCAGGD